jgi:hypothetical protein
VNTCQNGKARHVIVMPLCTAKSFNKIKNTTLVTTKLKQFNAYIAEHKFGITEWDITSLGWLRNLHPSLMSYNLVKNYIMDKVKANCPKKTRIPPYQFLNTSLWFKEPGSLNMRAKAMQISTTCQHSRALHKILITALAKNPIYIPWSMKQENTTNFKNNIRAQHKYLSTTWTIPLGGINRNKMGYLHNYFLKTGLVTAVHPHEDTNLQGCWNLLIHKDNYRQGLIPAQDMLSNYKRLVPDTTDVHAQWTFP